MKQSDTPKGQEILPGVLCRHGDTGSPDVSGPLHPEETICQVSVISDMCM